MPELIFKAKDWWHNEWELLYGERTVATLAMTKWTYSRAEVMAGGAKWEIGCAGWLGNRLFVRDSSGLIVIEGNSRNWWGGIVDIELEKKKYALQSNWWQTKFFATDESGSEVVSLKPQWWKGGAEISTILSPESKTVLLLASILFFLYKMAEMNTAGAAAAGSVVVTSS